MRKVWLCSQLVQIILVVSISALILSCGGANINDLKDKTVSGKSSSETIVDSDGNYTGSVAIDLSAEPEVNWNPADGTTNIILQFIPRNKNHQPLTSDQIKIVMKVNDADIDIESYLQSSAEELAFNVNFGLVLDASYSMLALHDSNAFTPMLAAAKDSVQTGIDIWKNRAGQFDFYVTWFNNYIYHAVNTLNNEWSPHDITTIPEPTSGSYTKLYSAINYQINQIGNIFDQGNKGPRDQNIVVVFSDGRDNYSFYDNSADSDGQAFFTNSGAEYRRSGYQATSLEDVFTKIENQQQLTVHVIGLGNEIDSDVLTQIANKGKGIYLQNPQTSEIENLFQRVIQEFTTLQTQGAKIPLQEGAYKFTLRIENQAGTDAAEYTFNFKTGDAEAGVLVD